MLHRHLRVFPLPRESVWPGTARAVLSPCAFGAGVCRGAGRSAPPWQGEARGFPHFLTQRGLGTVTPAQGSLMTRHLSAWKLLRLQERQCLGWVCSAAGDPRLQHREPRRAQNTGCVGLCTPGTSAGAFTAPPPSQDVSLRTTAPLKGFRYLSKTHMSWH